MAACAESLRPDVLDQLDGSISPVEEDQVEWESHPEGVDGPATPDEQRAAGRQLVETGEPAKARPKRASLEDRQSAGKLALWKAS